MIDQSGSGQAAAGGAGDAFDIGVLVERLDGDEEIAREVAGAFLESSRELVTQLETAISGHDPDQVRLHAHSIKGAAANIGATAVADLASEIEHAGRDGDLATAEQHFPQMRQRIECVFAVLEAW